MAATDSIFTNEVFRFFRDLSRNNHKVWMDENRDRYRTAVVEPFRVLLDRLTPFAHKLNPNFAASGRVGENFSRINRDIRFARDKSPYHAQMYLFFAEACGECQLYVGLSAESVTCGFRGYRESRTSPLATLGRERGQQHSQWIGEQRQELGRKYESYWYASEKGEWTKHPGWPLKPEDWKKLQGWVVRKKFARTAVIRAGFEREVAVTFREVYPLFSFASSPDWKLHR